MALESYEHGELVIEAELPGLDPHRDIEVWITNDVLHIRAKRDFVDEPPGHASDLRYGTFARDIALPPGTPAELVEARYLGTTLTVRAPQHAPAVLHTLTVPVRT